MTQRPQPSALQLPRPPQIPLTGDEQRQYREAWVHWKEERPRLAIARMRELVRSYPERAQHHYNLGSMLSATGDPEGAISAFRAAVRLAPDYPQALAGLGIALARQASIRAEASPLSTGDHGEDIALTLLFSEAAAALQHALRHAPSDESRHPIGIYLAFVLGRLRRYAEAGDAYREALKYQPGDADTLASLGRMLWAQQRLAEAAEAYEQAASLLSATARFRVERSDSLPAVASAPLYEEIARLYMLLNCPTAAVIKCRQALASDPDYPAAYQTLGRALEKMGDHEGARECLARFTHIEALENGGIKEHSGNPQSTVLALEERNRARRITARRDAGKAFRTAWKSGQFPEAAAALNRAIAVEPEVATHHYHLALVRQRQGYTAAAITALRRTLRLAPEHTRALSALGSLLARRAYLWERRPHRNADTVRRRYERALALLDRGVMDTESRRPLLYRAHLYRGLCLGRLNRPEEALGAVDQARALRPHSPGPLLLQADILWQEGRCGEAEATLRSLLAPPYTPTSEKRVAVYERLGRLLLFGLGEPERAADICRTALAMDCSERQRDRLCSTLAHALEQLDVPDTAARSREGAMRHAARSREGAMRHRLRHGKEKHRPAPHTTI